MPTEEKGVVSRNTKSQKGPSGNNYLLAISIDQYEHAPPLANCVQDAKAFIEVLTDKYDFEAEKEGKQLIYQLIDKQATRKNILKKLTEFKKKVGPEDNLIIYFSGHGETADNTGFWIPVEARPSEEDEFISTGEIIRKLNVINSFHTFLLIDACFSGSLFSTYKNTKAGVASKPSRWGLAASHSREVALDGNKGENSPFADRLLKILRDNMEDLSIHELSNELIKEVSRITRQKQVPVFQPLNVKGHELGQYVFHLKEDKEAQLVTELEASIKEGIELLEAGQIRKAKRYFNGLLKEVKEEIQNEQHKKRLTEIINEQLEACQNIPKYRAIIEKILNKKQTTGLAKVQKSVADKERLLQQIQEQLVKEKREAKTRVNQLQAEVSNKKKEITALNAEVNKQDAKIKKKETALQESQRLYQKAEAKLKQLQQDLSKREKQITQLEKTMKELKGKNQTKVRKKENKVLADSVENIPIEMVFVKGGTFTMGREVTLDDYYIGKYPVTQELWQAIMGNNPSCYSDDPKCPVEDISWHDAEAFIKKFNQKTRKNYRLPTEAEWEFAARGGNLSKGFKFAGSDNLAEVAWYRDNSNKQTHPVGQKKPNELGIYDMSGNVWEWCKDWFGDFEKSLQKNPDGPKSGSYRVLRGGCWDDDAEVCQISIRDMSTPDLYGSDDGFRLAHSQ